MRRDHLQVRVDGGADRQPAAEKLVFAEVAAELAADLVGEIVARRQRRAERRVIAGLHREQRLGHCGFVGRIGDIAVLAHLFQHVVAPRHGVVVLALGMQVAGALRERGEIGGILRLELVEGLVEIGLRRRSHAKRVLAEEDLVEVEAKDLLLVQRGFEPGGEDQLLDLALGRAVGREQEVFHHLLGDRRGAAQPAAARRFQRRGHHAAHVIALVDVEVLVLGRDKGVFHQIGNLLGRGVEAALAGKLVHQPATARVDPADRRRLVVGKLLMARQVPGIHPENRAQRQRTHDCGQGQPGKDRADEAQDESDHARPRG